MRRVLLLMGILFFATLSITAQYSRYVVKFTDKKNTPHSLSNPSTYLSAKAIARRAKQNISIDSTDLPITPAYLDSIRSVPNVTVLNVSKWFNQVLVKTTDPAALVKINSFPFVKTAAPIALNVDNIDKGQPITNEKYGVVGNELIGMNGLNGTHSLSYGNSYNQIHLHEGEYLHDLGFTGKGITIAILDGGFFGYKTNAAMDSVRSQNRILGVWDYVANEESVNEDHPHGLYCFSIIAGNKPGSLMGSAPHASFYLFRTEDVNSEYPVEEQNWVAAAEYADSVGVDMISSSLGYYDFDDASFNHSYAQRNGNTALVTLGADLAAKKGIIVTNSAGNSGNATNDTKYIACPADGDSVVAVGAVTQAGIRAKFSSWGPNGAGARKPNIVSVGQATVLANTAGNASSGNGTSFSNPLACGLIACLWQAYPEFTNMEIINAVQKSSSTYTSPNDSLGYGIPNFRKAYEYLAAERLKKNQDAILGSNWIKIYPVPFKQSLSALLKAPNTGKATLRLFNSNGQLVELKQLDVQSGSTYTLSFGAAAKLSAGVYIVEYRDGTSTQRITIQK